MTRLKTNHDMFATRGDRWDQSQQKGYFEPERLIHVAPGEGVWSKLTARSGFFTLDGEPAATPDPTEQGPDIDRWTRAERANVKRNRRKQSIIGRSKPPAKPPEAPSTAHARTAANLIAQYRAGKFAKSVTVR